MRPGERCGTVLALRATIHLPGDVNIAAIKNLSILVVAQCCTVALLANGTATAGEPQDPSAAKPTKPVEVILYPILVQAPIYGATIKLPSIPSTPGDGGESNAQSGSTDFGLNSAYMAGVVVRAPQWFGEVRGTWAALSATREAPRARLDTDATLFNGRGGIRMFDELFATVGFRRVGVTLNAELTLPELGKSVQGTTTQALWDPLIGVDWRHRAGRWIVDGNFQGGGFGVGTDVDLSGEAHASWRGIPHTEIRLGFSVVYYKLTVADVSIGSFQRTLVSSQTLYGPIVGLGFFF